MGTPSFRAMESICLPNYPPPPPCASTALSKHESLFDCCFPNCSFRFPLVGTTLSKHGTRLTVVFLTFGVLVQGGGGGTPRLCAVTRAESWG